MGGKTNVDRADALPHTGNTKSGVGKKSPTVSKWEGAAGTFVEWAHPTINKAVWSRKRDSLTVLTNHAPYFLHTWMRVV